MFDERAFMARIATASPEELKQLLTRPSAQEEKALRAYFGEENYPQVRSLALKFTSNLGGFNERAFMMRLESADPAELTELLMRPTAQEEKSLRSYFGDERYQRVHSMALKLSGSRARRKLKGNVVVIPGIMGSELTAVNRSLVREQIWVNALSISKGSLTLLRLHDDGRNEFNEDCEIRATGVLKRQYGEMLLSLSSNWNVRAFWFDWRKDLNLAADALQAQISSWFGDTAPVHIVAHGMGGLVARTFVKKHPRRWKEMASRDLREGGRLIMIGTPNHGSFAMTQMITGLSQTIKKIDLLDLHHPLPELLAVINSFVGLYQMLPSHLVVRDMLPLYDAKTYGDLNVPQRYLDNAKEHHEWLADVVDPRRMISVAGDNQLTLSDIENIKKAITERSVDAYAVSMAGDGFTTHKLMLLKKGGEQVPSYFIENRHNDMTSNIKVLDALEDLLVTGKTEHLADHPAGVNGAVRGDRAGKKRRQEYISAQTKEEERLTDLARRLSTRSTDSDAPLYVTTEERGLEESITRGIMVYQTRETSSAAVQVPFAPTRITIGLVAGGIESAYDLKIDGPPVDAVAVGHYIGVKPTAAEMALDKAISSALVQRAGRRGGSKDGKAKLYEGDLILTQYSERGTIRGEIGQPFFMPDPRAEVAGNRIRGAQPVIAIAGMGLPGRFGVPELTVLARELCWSLGRQGKRHLATVLIGAGNGNLMTREAINAWVRGIKHAVTGALEDERRHLLQITFIEFNPLKIKDIQDAIMEEQRRLKGRLDIKYVPFDDDELNKLRTEGLEAKARKEKKALEDEIKAIKQNARQRNRRAQNGKGSAGASGGEDKGSRPPQPSPIATRITLALERNTYRFGAITRDASIPEREIPIDPETVMKANDEIAAESLPQMQLERGQFMERLLVPEDLRSQIFTDAPLVMMLDSTTANIHWEMVAQADLTSSFGAEGESRRPKQSEDDYLEYFLGTRRGFTRQLRTTFSPPPEPPPPPRRLLRVLVVADPAEDARLPGAEEEGVEVADMFDSFNRVYEKLSHSRVEVKRLFGPREATLTNVMRELMMRFYDVLHFAGHCVYDHEEPTASGWIFTDGQRLTANELKRIDRIPKFIFSNACESGITPDRSDLRSVALAPTFAESFFARGVSNFVCTAWPVDDLAAREFALRLYAGLLGLTLPTDEPDHTGKSGRGVLEPMHIAMREARRRIAVSPNGARTWGAYQHYGNPFFQFFTAETLMRG